MDFEQKYQKDPGMSRVKATLSKNLQLYAYYILCHNTNAFPQLVSRNSFIYIFQLCI